MPRLTIDNREVEVPPGGTLLDAARKLGLEIPTLCFLDGLEPSTSCMICLVKVREPDRLVPSCATVAEEGMQVESETEEVHAIRRTGLELLLSDHVGDCTAPCRSACPAHMDIPLMLRQVAAGKLRDAIATVKKDIALPATLGRICPEPCEQACRRRDIDSPVAICRVKRYVADVDLASETPYLPPCKPGTGKKVAIVGAGPAGLSAAWHLTQAGHDCTVFDDHGKPGGSLRHQADISAGGSHPLHDVLDAEIALVKKLGATFRMGVTVGKDVSLTNLKKEHDAVLVAIGAICDSDAERLGLPASRGRLEASTRTWATSTPGVFAAGDAVQPSKLAVRSVAHGKAAAFCIDQYFSGARVTGPPKPFTFRAGRLRPDEIEQMATGAARYDRVAPSGDPDSGLTGEEAKNEALRCLHCDCGKQTGCKLRRYAALYGADPNRYRGERRRLERHRQHGDIIYEPGKCILCGLCVQIATEAKEPLGLTFVGRGFDVRVDVPFNESIAEGLTRTAKRCAEACPTGALTVKTDGGDPHAG